MFKSNNHTLFVHVVTFTSSQNEQSPVYTTRPSIPTHLPDTIQQREVVKYQITIVKLRSINSYLFIKFFLFFLKLFFFNFQFFHFLYQFIIIFSFVFVIYHRTFHFFQSFQVTEEISFSVLRNIIVAAFTQPYLALWHSNANSSCFRCSILRSLASCFKRNKVLFSIKGWTSSSSEDN